MFERSCIIDRVSPFSCVQGLVKEEVVALT